MPGPLSSLYKVFSVRSGTCTKLCFSWFFCHLCTKCSSCSQVHVQTVLICWFFCNLCPMCFSCDQVIVLVQTVLLRVLSYLCTKLPSDTCTSCTSAGSSVISVLSVLLSARYMYKLYFCWFFPSVKSSSCG